MALASTSATAPAVVLKTPLLGARRALANAAAPKPAPRRALLAIAAAAAKKLWIPAFKSDAEFINPPWPGSTDRKSLQRRGGGNGARS
jgi:light-harvesting complex II chlorophyll a/b binding protein 6